jgi:hypothetical protein
MHFAILTDLLSVFAGYFSQFTQHSGRYLPILCGLLLATANGSEPAKSQLAAEAASDAANSGPVSSTVKIVLEVKGSLFTGTDKSRAKSKELPFRAIANLTYSEAIEETVGSERASRRYHEAVSQIDVSNRAKTVAIRDNRKAIRCDFSSDPPLIFSPDGPLTRDELDLLTLPFNAAAVDHLLPQDEVKPGMSWTHEPGLLAKLLNLDAVSSTDVFSKLVEFNAKMARLELAGKVVGAVDGVATDIELTGKYTFDIELDRITWLAIGIKEQRAVGPATPGFQAEARVRILIADAKQDVIPVQESAAPDLAGHTFLEYQPPDGIYSFIHDRRWHIVAEHPGQSILRLVEDGEAIAQCNLRQVRTDSKTQEVDLERFKADVFKALGNTPAQLVQADESTNSSGLRILRVQIAGETSGAPVQWIYYLATDARGQGLSYVFTMSGTAVERFGAADFEITNGLQFTEPTNVSDATAASASESVRH